MNSPWLDNAVIRGATAQAYIQQARRDAQALLDELEAAGLHLDTAGNSLRVRPSDRLTDNQRQRIRDMKPALITLLRRRKRTLPTTPVPQTATQDTTETHTAPNPDQNPEPAPNPITTTTEHPSTTALLNQWASRLRARAPDDWSQQPPPVFLDNTADRWCQTRGITIRRKSPHLATITWPDGKQYRWERLDDQSIIYTPLSTE